MFHEKLRRVGDEYEVTIPDAEVERLGLQEGQWVSVEIWAAAGASELPPDARGAFEASWAENEAIYRDLAEH